MAITINGSGSITGLSAGGLPDGSVTNDDLAGSIADGKITGVSSSKLSGALPARSGASLTGLPIQAEEDYWSLDMSSATGTTVHTISGSFTPKLAWMTFNPNGAYIGMVTGWMNVSGNTAGSQNATQASAGKYWQGNSMFQCPCVGGTQYIDMTASASGQYTITNTHPGGTLSGTGYFSLILFGN